MKIILLALCVMTVGCKTTENRSAFLERGGAGDSEDTPTTKVFIEIVKGSGANPSSLATSGRGQGKEGSEGQQVGYIYVYNGRVAEISARVFIRVKNSYNVGITEVYNKKIHLYKWNGKRLKDLLGDYKGKSGGVTVGVGFRYLNVHNKQGIQIKDSAFKLGVDADWPSNATLEIVGSEPNNPLWNTRLIRQ